MRDPQLVEELITAVNNYLTSLNAGMLKIKDKGVRSLEFQAEADQTTAALQDIKNVMNKLREIE